MGDVPDGQTVADRIEDIRRGIERAELEKDAEALGRFLAPDVVMCPEGGPEIAGVDAVVDYHRERYETWGEVDIAFTIEEVDTVGGVAVERGRYEYAIGRADGDGTARGGGDYLYVYERVDDDTWQVIRLSWG